MLQMVSRRRRLFFGLWGGLLLACIAYCVVAPKQYESSAKVALRQAPESALGMQASGPLAAASILSAPLQLETLANVLRSETLAWRVILRLKLYDAAGFSGRFAGRFPGFRPDAPAVDAREWLLDRFERRLLVESVPRTLVLEIQFRSRDAALSAAVVNELIRSYGEHEIETRQAATAQGSAWLEGQLKELKARAEQDQQRLTSFQNAQGILGAPSEGTTEQPGQAVHDPALLAIDAAEQELVSATAGRILREAEFRAASEGDPELVLASDSGLPGGDGNLETTSLEQLRAQSSALQQEQAQLSAEHGPNFPRVVEIRRQLLDLEAQKQDVDRRLVERFRSAWQVAQERETSSAKNLAARTAEGMKHNEAATRYAAMVEEAEASHALAMRVFAKIEEAGLNAGIESSSISVVDYAREPAKPVAPNLTVYLAITLFAGFWLALGGALLAETFWPSSIRKAALLMIAAVCCAALHGQAPTPTTSGLPAGIIKPVTDDAPGGPANAKDAPAIWNQAPGQVNQAPPSGALTLAPMPGVISAGDQLDVSEFHTPAFHSQVRVAADGTVVLPMVDVVMIGGLDEQAASRRIEQALVTRGMLLHPQVTVLVTSSAGRDVSVLGEVARPGVYAYSLHHRLLDLISAAAGLSPNAGRLVNVFHRSEPSVPHPVVLDPGGTDTEGDHNPELLPGDTVEVSRAGLVYVIGDVVRPGGFPVDPAQGLTVVQALSLAWGPTQNAGASKALLIREQKGGRTLTTLNLRRMIHGQDPDQPILDRDIIFVPDSTAKNLWNKSLESAIQSAVGVTIYAALVYSQRF